MFDSAVIDFKDDFKYKDEFLFRIKKLKQSRFIYQHTINDKNIIIINIPFTYKSILNGKRFRILVKHFISFLKEKGINKIILSDRAEKIKIIKDNLKEDFYIFEGKSVINYNFSNIIKKYISRQEKENYEIIFCLNDHNKFYDYFKDIFDKYKISGIITEKKADFYDLLNEIFYEYGIPIKIFSEDKFICKNNYIIINFDMNLNFKKADIDFKNISVIFSRCESLSFVYNYFKCIDEKVLELVIYVVYGDLKKLNITEFFNKYNIRIVKINKK